MFTCIVDVRSINYQLGTPRGRYDEHNSKFSLSKKPRFNRPVGERKNFRRLLLADFGNGSRELVYGTCLGRSFGASSNVEPAHITQPRYFAPTCSEVVNLTGLLKTKD
jgi:hypothetical protein